MIITDEIGSYDKEVTGDEKKKNYSKRFPKRPQPVQITPSLTNYLTKSTLQYVLCK